MSFLGIDYSFARPNLDACAAAGVHAIGRYLWPNTYGSKGINRAEYDAIRARGMGVWYIYEEDGTELLGGFTAGVAAARRAKSIIASQGLPPQPVFFTIDRDFTGAQLTACVEAVKGAASVLGYSQTGIYGGYEHIIAMQQAHACGLFFQTYAWSGGRVAPGVHIYQRKNGQTIGGGTVDLCTIFDAVNYGMASAGTTTSGDSGSPLTNGNDVFDKEAQEFLNNIAIDIKSALRREDRGRLYYCSTPPAGLPPFVCIFWDRDPADGRNILYANAGETQVRNWNEVYYQTADTVEQAKKAEMRPDKYAALIEFAKGNDSAFTNNLAAK